MNGMLDIARRRYTAKHYDASKPLTDEEFDALLEILRLAPSSVNIQPWHFYVIRSPEARAKLLPAIKDFNIERVEHCDAIVLFTIERDLVPRAARVTDQEMKDGRFDAAAIASGFDKTVLRVREAGVSAYCSGPDRGEIWAREQASIALGFLLFAAAGMGVDATSLGGIEFERADEIFGFPALGRKCVIGCALGHHSADDANAARPKSRFPRDEVITVL
ncbi:nitroreductase family protein [Sutterella sp.]|uniref:nitroreductase family protein n=1 Tax=Sutterella sp. TaxID=1981025 RepID=UPI0026E0F7BD|nr:nitroreductase family protein [Sutterella sp.]MDO5531348.1 nitroreductase family protein [Sutterella sp.]